MCLLSSVIMNHTPFHSQVSRSMLSYLAPHFLKKRCTVILQRVTVDTGKHHLPQVSWRERSAKGMLRVWHVSPELILSYELTEIPGRFRKNTPRKHIQTERSPNPSPRLMYHQQRAYIPQKSNHSCLQIHCLQAHCL